MSFTVILTCLMLNIYHESRGEGYDGMAATAIITMKRADHNPEKVCDAVFHPYWFSWTNNLTQAPDQEVRNYWARRLMPEQGPTWEAARVVALQALDGKLDSEIVATVGESDHYYNPKAADPFWKDAYPYVGSVMNHNYHASGRKSWNVAATISKVF